MALEAVQVPFDPLRDRREIVLVSSQDEYTGWTLQRSNYALNPYSIAGGAAAIGYSGTNSFAVGVSAAGRTWYQVATTVTSNASFTVAGQVIPAVAGDTVYASVRVRNPNASALDFSFTLRGRTSPNSPTGGSQTTIYSMPAVTIPAGGEHVFEGSWVVTGATTQSITLTPVRSTGGAAAVGDLIQVTDWYLSDQPGLVFAGSDADTETERHEWAGAANDSINTLETREVLPGLKFNCPYIEFFPHDPGRVRQEVVVVPYDPEHPRPIYQEI